MTSIAIMGGGAAGFFAGLRAKAVNPDAQVTIYEKSAKLLSKVRVSGGGRCNVTHHCFDPKELIQNYPRGQKELLGPFHTFGPQDTVDWFESRGVELKTEKDGRMFPATDNSQTIIDCLLDEAKKLGVEIVTRHKTKVEADRLILATGSSKEGYAWAQEAGHTIVEPVPSLFTFNIPDFPLVDLAGVSVPQAKVSVGKLTQEGPLLITHWGFSGPAALKLSAWGARYLFEHNYEVELRVNWTGQSHRESFLEAKRTKPSQTLAKMTPLPKKLWRRLIERSGLDPDAPLRTCTDKGLSKLAEILSRDTYQVRGKTTNKEEFVTCGGIALPEVNFKTMESRLQPGLFFAGEILNIDGVTGGFNFQNAWTTGFLAGSNSVFAKD